MIISVGPVATFGERLREARKGAGLTQTQLERLSGISQSMISALEKGERPSPSVETVLALERALGLVPGTLIWDANDASLEKFLRSELAKELEVTDYEARRLRVIRWRAPDEEADLQVWADLLRVVRSSYKR